jgi:hypothetical protein
MLNCKTDRRKLMRTATQSALALAVGASLPAWAKGSGGSLPSLGSVLKLPRLTLLDGNAWNAADLEQKTLVVYWWASWCPFCALQSPHIEALWRGQKASGLSVLALSIDRQAATAIAYMKAKNYSFPAAMLTPEVARLLPKPAGLPVLVVLKLEGGNGRVVFAESGEMFPGDVEGLKKYL